MMIVIMIIININNNNNNNSDNNKNNIFKNKNNIYKYNFMKGLRRADKTYFFCKRYLKTTHIETAVFTILIPGVFISPYFTWLKASTEAALIEKQNP